jgi:hypothetical protein
MKRLLIVILAFVSLSGCATGCQRACLFGFGPGASAFDQVANHYDSRDPCQSKNWPENGGKMNMSRYDLRADGYPTFCGASKGKTVRITKAIGPNSYIINTQ